MKPDSKTLAELAMTLQIAQTYLNELALSSDDKRLAEAQEHVSAAYQLIDEIDEEGQQ